MHRVRRDLGSHLVCYHARGARVSFGVPDFEQRLSDLQAQLDRLGHSSGGDPARAEQHVSALADQCAEIVRRWSVVAERHARVVSRFEADVAEWTAAAVRAQEDTGRRLEDLEARLQREWDGHRARFEEPVRQLHEHATSLTQVSVATANTVEQHFVRSEARLAAIEEEIGRRLAALPSRDASPQANPQLVASLDLVAERLTSLEQALADRESAPRAASEPPTRDLRLWQFALLFVSLLTLASGILAWRLLQDARAATAAVEDLRRERVTAIDGAARELAAARESSAAALKEAALRAEQVRLISAVLAAPDVSRYDLGGRDNLTGAVAQLRWSRSRGLVFAGSKIPLPPTDSVYQLWLLTGAGPLRTATFVPDEAGVVTVALPVPETAGAITGAMVTIEPAGGSEAPTTSPVLVRSLDVNRSAPLQP